MTTIESQNASDTIPPASTPDIENTQETQTTFSESEFNRAAVDKLGNKVRITDRDDENNLDLICYVRCNSEDNNIIKQCRGVVFSGNKVVMKAFPYTTEYSHKEGEKVETKLSDNFNKCAIYDAHEGALIRMFYFENKWYTSTHRKLNAFRSKWASKESFGTSLKKALEYEVENNEKLKESLPSDGETILENFQKILNIEKQYMFLIRNTDENRIVCKAPENPVIYHVGTFVNGELVMTENINIPYPTKHNFSCVDEMLDYVSQIDIRVKQGVIVFSPDNFQCKILNDDYQELFNARGNEPSIKFRYLQVRMNQRIVDMLFHLYPHMAKTFDEYENALYAIARNIHHSYVQRHIKGRWSQLPNEEYAVDKACHAWHEEDHKMNRVKLEKVVEFLNEQPATNLNKMIRRYQEGNSTQQEIQTNVKTRNRSNTFTQTNKTSKGNVNSPLLLTKQPNEIKESIEL